jgi:ABC-type branched-subunit amino acid transport system substrate-binding protein
MPAVAVETFNPDERDFRVLLLKVREKHPDTVIPLAMSPQMEIILRQMKQLDFRPRVVTIEDFDFVSDLTDAEGLYYVSGGNATDEFNRKLRDASGKEATYGVPTIYDGLNLIRSAYETLDGPNHVAAARWIAQAKDFPSAMGRVSVNAKGRIDSELGFYRVVHGKPVAVKLEEVK